MSAPLQPDTARVTALRGADAARAGIGVFLGTAYSLALCAVYQNIVVPEFAYLSFTSTDPQIGYVCLTALLAGLCSLLVPKSVTRPSDFATLFIYIVVTVPMIVFPGFFGPIGAGLTTYPMFSGVLGLVIFVVTCRVFRRLSIPKLRLRRGIGLQIVVLLTLACIVLVGVQVGFRIQIHSLSDVYDQRDEFKGDAVTAGYLTYVVGALQNTLGPLLLAYGLKRRSVLLVALGSFAAIFVYSATGLKSSFASIFFVVVVYVVMSTKGSRRFFNATMATLIGVLAVGALLSSTKVGSVLVDLVVRRVLVIQGMLAYYYGSLFSSSPPSLLSQTVFSAFFKAPIIDDPAGTVGAYLFGDGVHANVNFLVDGWVNGKTVGVVIAAVLGAVYFKLVDTLMVGHDRRFAIAATSMAAYIAVQTSLLVALVTQGGLLLLVLLFVQDPDEIVVSAPAKKIRFDLPSRSKV